MIDDNNIKNEPKPIIAKLTGEILYPCTSCAEQCRGHGGGRPLYDGGCMCNDGIKLECLM